MIFFIENRTFILNKEKYGNKCRKHTCLIKLLSACGKKIRFNKYEMGSFYKCSIRDFYYMEV